MMVKKKKKMKPEVKKGEKKSELTIDKKVEFKK